LSPSRSSPSHPASSSSPSPLDSSTNQPLFPLTILITPDAPSSDELQPSDGPASFSQGPDLARQLFCYLVAQFGMLGFPGVTAPPIWVPDSFSPVCLVCLTKFTFSRRRHHCRRCGTLICRACSSFKDFPAERKLPSSSSSSSPSFLKVRLCINCTQLDPSLVRLSLLNPDPAN
ncbi:MAG: FYVE zinc finger domain-containing protein, partial [archaeon]|nr:FYVE zinc finger domain-containing protein [archaeon]